MKFEYRISTELYNNVYVVDHKEKGKWNRIVALPSLRAVWGIVWNQIREK